MTASHRGGLGDGLPDIVSSGGWRGYKDRPVDLTATRRRVAAIAAVVVVLVAGWAGRISWVENHIYRVRDGRIKQWWPTGGAPLS